jgi:hypothetical protein
VEELLKLHHLCIYHVLWWSELRYIISVKGSGAVNSNHGPGSNWPPNCGFMSGLGNNPTLPTRFGFLEWSAIIPNRISSPNLDCWWIALTRWLYYTCRPPKQYTMQYSHLSECVGNSNTVWVPSASALKVLSGNPMHSKSHHKHLYHSCSLVFQYWFYLNGQPESAAII